MLPAIRKQGVQLLLVFRTFYKIQDLNFTILEIFHAASAINSVEAEEVLHAFMRDKNTDSFAMVSFT